MASLTDKKILELEKKANDIRQSIIEMLLEAKSGHFHAFLLPYLAPRPEKSQLGRARPLRALERPHLPGLLRDHGARRIFPGGRIENLAQIRHTPARTPASRIYALAGDFFRALGRWAFPGHWYGACRPNGWERRAEIHLRFFIRRGAR